MTPARPVHDCLVTIVVPCFNEAQRLNVDAYRSYLGSEPAVTLLFVNDGSTDGTAVVLENLRRSCSRVEVLHLPENRGKAEAVRHGMLKALATLRSVYVGYWDADLATPLETIDEFVVVMRENPAIRLVLGARVKLLGRTIVRNEWRHYAGRVFATAASLALRLPIYDTQCGAKLFVADDRLAEVLEAPFSARWVFDVELLARFQALAAQDGRFEDIVYEFPLREWRDIAGSKVRPQDFVRAMFDLASIRLKYRHVQRRCANGDAEQQPATPGPPASRSSVSEPNRALLRDMAKGRSSNAPGRLAVWLSGISGAAYFAFSDSVKVYIDVLVSNVAKTFEILSR